VNRRRFVRHALCLTALAPFVASARADEETYAGHFMIYRPWTPEPARAGTDVPVYLEFQDITGDDLLLGATSRAANAVDIVSPGGDSLAALALRAGTEPFDLGPKSVHLVLRGLRMDLEWYRVYPLELRFARAGTIFTHIEIGEE
jgi:hypothetical protein